MVAKLGLLLACLMSLPLETKEAKVTPLFSKDLADFPGQGRSDDHRGVSTGQFRSNTSP